jgi:hypothetical protein
MREVPQIIGHNEIGICLDCGGKDMTVLWVGSLNRINPTSAIFSPGVGKYC